jgi:hydrogenase nickel incorporation protein HypB
VSLVSTPEGDDKPLKYPGAMHTSDAVLFTKTDLAPHVDFDLELARKNALKIESNLAVMALSAKSGEGMDAWFDWFGSHAEKHSDPDKSRDSK